MVDNPLAKILISFFVSYKGINNFLIKLFVQFREKHFWCNLFHAGFSSTRIIYLF